jgi:hypothetical protein
LVNELAAHPLCFERFGAGFDPRILVADAVVFQGKVPTKRANTPVLV